MTDTMLDFLLRKIDYSRNNDTNAMNETNCGFSINLIDQKDFTFATMYIYYSNLCIDGINYVTWKPSNNDEDDSEEPITKDTFDMIFSKATRYEVQYEGPYIR